MYVRLKQLINSIYKQMICRISTITSWHHGQGNTFFITGPVWGESTDDRWIPSQMDSNTQCWCLLCRQLEQLLSKESFCRWFHSLWRSSDVAIMIYYWRHEFRIRVTVQSAVWTLGNFVYQKWKPNRNWRSLCFPRDDKERWTRWCIVTHICVSELGHVSQWYFP